MPEQRYALLGWPVKHSVSPQMQEAGFRAIGLDTAYELVEVPPEQLAHKVRELTLRRYRGWNITVPHKQAMLRLVDVVEPAAALAGSINTVVNADGRLVGHSTDGYGLAMALREAFGLMLPKRHFLFWGAGGAARATSVYFAASGARAITLVNRTRERAAALADAIRAAAPACAVTVLEPAETAAIRDRLDDVDALIQATSVGLHAADPIAIPEELLRPGLNVMDMIYRPTRLLERAAELGCRAVDGKSMLLYQGVRSFELWTGAQPPPVAAMRAALDAALAAQARL